MGIFDPYSLDETSKRRSVIDETAEVMIGNSQDERQSKKKRRTKQEKGGRKNKKGTDVKSHADDVVATNLKDEDEGQVQRIVSKILKKDTPPEKVQQEIELTDISNNNM